MKIKTKKVFIFLEKIFLDLFHKFGRIKNVQIVIDKKTNKSRGFGFVYFDEIESATRVIKKHQIDFFKEYLFE